MINERIIKDIYQNSQMGIIGIDEVLYKVQDPRLLKEITGIKKEYQKINKKCQKYLDEKGECVKDVSMKARLSSEFIAQMKLNKLNNDPLILDMMIKGTEKSINILTNKRINYEKCDLSTLKITTSMFSLLSRSLGRLKKL